MRLTRNCLVPFPSSRTRSEYLFIHPLPGKNAKNKKNTRKKTRKNSDSPGASGHLIVLFPSPGSWVLVKSGSKNTPRCKPIFHFNNKPAELRKKRCYFGRKCQNTLRLAVVTRGIWIGRDILILQKGKNCEKRKICRRKLRPSDLSWRSCGISLDIGLNLQ